MAAPKSVEMTSSSPSSPTQPGGPPSYTSAPEKPGLIAKIFGGGGGKKDTASSSSSASPPAAAPVKRRIKAIDPNPVKKFYFRLDKITASYEIQLDKCFLEFEFGGVSKSEIVDTGETVPKKRKVKGPDGKDVEEEYQDRVLTNRIQIIKPRADVYYTRIKTNVKPKVLVAYHDHNHEGFWYGPYSDLERESITVKLWHFGGTTEQNHLIGIGKEWLKDIVASKIDRELRVLKYIPGAASYRKETMARLTYKLEFQEDYKYNIIFRDWELRRIHEPIFKEVPRKRGPYGCCVSGDRHLSFEILQSHQGWSEWITSNLKAYLFPCAAKRWDNRCELPVQKEGTSGLTLASIQYPGTRAWLEDESLSITLSKKVCCCVPIVIGKKAEELQGVLDYGHIDTTIDIQENINLLTYCTSLFHEHSLQSFKIAGTVDSSGLLESAAGDLPIFRQLGNADPSQDGLIQQEGATFLVIKLLRAKGLTIPSRDEFKETLNPSVTIYWNGMQKSSRIMKTTCDPVWDDEVHFKIMDRHTQKKQPPRAFEEFPDIVKESTIELLVWDNDGLCGRTPLGKCTVDFQDIYYRRKKKKIISFTSNGRAVERLVFSSGEKSLDAPFATDGSERKKGGEGKQEEKSSDEFKTKFVDFLVYFDRMDSNPIPLIPKKHGKNAPEPASSHQMYDHSTPLTPAAIKSGRAYWDQALSDVLRRDERYFPFYGIDEYSGTYHFLPSFLKPMQPPAEVRSIGTLLFYIYVIEMNRKPDPFIDPMKDSTNPSRGDVWTWADPFFFLEKRKGDVKDHALVLCNFLLGLGMDAYICIGQARCKNKAQFGYQPHYWVMTRETVEEQEGEAVPPAATLQPGAARTDLIVRFWETTNGKTYILKSITDPPPNPSGKRYLEQPDVRPPPIDEDFFKKQREAQAELARQLRNGKEPDVELLPDQGQKYPPVVVPGIQVIDGAMRANLDKKELLSLELHNQQMELDLTFVEEEDDDELPDEQLLALTLGKDLLNTRGPVSILPDAHVKTKAALDEKTDQEAVRSIFNEEVLAKVENDRTTRRHQRELVLNLEDPQLKQTKKQLQHQCPYSSIDVVFNHKHLYANLASADPELIFYDFERHPERWCEFQESSYKQYLQIAHLKEFYGDKGVASVKAPQRDAEELEMNLIELIKDTIRTHRKYPSGNSTRPSMDTEFLKQFEFQQEGDVHNGAADIAAASAAAIAEGKPVPVQNKENTALAYILKRLDHEHQVALQPKELQSLIKSRGGIVDPHLNYDYVDKEWRRRILQDLQPGYTYREVSLLLKHSDSNRVANETIRKCQEMIETGEFRKPRFAVACRLYRMAASVCPVRVIVCVIAKDA